MRWSLVAAAIALSGNALANDLGDVETADGRLYTFHYDSTGLRVERAGRSASLRSLGVPSMAIEPEIKAVGNSVVIDGEGICGSLSTTVAADALDARIENAAGYRLLKKNKKRDAITLFRKAVALDADFAIAATNLASAQMLAGDTADADATIERAMARRPLETVRKVFSDPDLGGLRTGKTISALGRSDAAVQLSRDGRLSSGPAYAKDRGWLAFVLPDQPGGADCTDGSVLVVVDAGSRREIYRAAVNRYNELDAPRDCMGERVDKESRARARARVDALNHVLAAYGFEAIPSERGRVDDAGKLRFSIARIGVVAGKSQVSAFRKGKRIGGAPIGGFGYFSGGWFADSLDVAIATWGYDCAHNVDESFYAVIGTSEP
jgi:tetratricopeptide (TPR) repeat protein